jgi:hypothetical protein
MTTFHLDPMCSRHYSAHQDPPSYRLMFYYTALVTLWPKVRSHDSVLIWLCSCKLEERGNPADCNDSD